MNPDDKVIELNVDTSRMQPEDVERIFSNIDRLYVLRATYTRAIDRIRVKLIPPDVEYVDEEDEVYE